MRNLVEQLDDLWDQQQAMEEREQMIEDILIKVRPHLTEDEYKHLCYETGKRPI